MKKVFKSIGIGLGSLIVLILIAALTLFLMGNARLNNTYDFPATNLELPTDAESLAYGMSTKNETSIKVIVELHAKPGRRAELMNLLANVVARYGSGQAGFLSSLQYEVIDNPDILVEIADWDSAEARATAMQQAMNAGAYAPLEDLLAAPFRATVIRQLS